MKQTLDRLTLVAVFTLLVVGTIVLGGSSCGSNPPKPIADVVDCTRQDSAQILAAESTCAAKLPDWRQVEACVVAELPTIGWQVGGCVLADLVQQYLSTKAAAQDVTESNSARDSFEDFRAKYGHGEAFHVGGADL